LAAPLQIRFFTSSSHRQGTYFRFHHLARGLAELGHEVTVHASDHDSTSVPRIERRDGVTYELVPESTAFAVFAAPCHPVTVVRRATKPAPACDIAHLFQPFPSALGPWLRTPAQARFYDWDEVWAGGLYPKRPRRPGEAWAAAVVAPLERWLPRKADHTTVVGEWLGERARRYGASQTSVIHNGFVPRPLMDKGAARDQLGLRPDALYLAFIGRTPHRLEWCFEALERSAEREASVRLLLAGPLADGVGQASAAARERIDFLGDLPPDQAALCAEAADIGLLPMDDDTWNRSRFAIKYSDSLGAGLHLVCSDVGECGRLARANPAVFPAGTTREGWLEAVERAVRRCAALEWPRRAAPEASSDLTWPTIAQKLAAVYLRAVGSPERVTPRSPAQAGGEAPAQSPRESPA
jgi:glycosyltransferase involved in cell wall biosynthesis